jgi:hypothetical protein
MRSLYLFACGALLVFGLTYLVQHLPKTQGTIAQTANTSASVKTGDATLYPNPELTPGDILTKDTAKVCASGYSSTVRNVPSTLKKQIYAEYGVSYPQPEGSYEVDHFISLELGGSNAAANLWPEPAAPVPGFHQKDMVENYLHSQVCKGAITLTDAQKQIANDWYAVYLQIKN